MENDAYLPHLVDLPGWLDPVAPACLEDSMGDLRPDVKYLDKVYNLRTDRATRAEGRLSRGGSNLS